MEKRNGTCGLPYYNEFKSRYNEFKSRYNEYKSRYYDFVIKIFFLLMAPIELRMKQLYGKGLFYLSPFDNFRPMKIFNGPYIMHFN